MKPSSNGNGKSNGAASRRNGHLALPGLNLPESSEPLRILCIGAHSDDIEIGCGGTLSQLVRRNPRSA